ncbi:MAG: hypothetical protein L6R35_006567, partial [Caloplaca aegaea]
METFPSNGSSIDGCYKAAIDVEVPIHSSSKPDPSFQTVSVDTLSHHTPGTACDYGLRVSPIE